MKTVVVIEENWQLRENTAELLELKGYKVLKAKNGEAGFELAKQNHPDVVICDMLEPDTDGVGFLLLLEQDSTMTRLPLIFFSEDTTTPLIKKMVSDERTLYLRKPFTQEELYSAVERSVA